MVTRAFSSDRRAALSCTRPVTVPVVAVCAAAESTKAKLQTSARTRAQEIRLEDRMKFMVFAGSSRAAIRRPRRGRFNCTREFNAMVFFLQLSAERARFGRNDAIGCRAAACPFDKLSVKLGNLRDRFASVPGLLQYDLVRAPAGILFLEVPGRPIAMRS